MALFVYQPFRSPYPARRVTLPTKQYLKKRKSKRYLHIKVFQRKFNILSNDILVNRLCTCVSLVIDV